MLQVKLIKSPIGDNPRNRATVEALGLRKLQQVVYKPDIPVFRGMIHKVKHLLEVKVVDDKSVAKEKK
jgi:large subunit ribosomal protein L30